MSDEEYREFMQRMMEEERNRPLMPNMVSSAAYKYILRREEEASLLSDIDDESPTN